MSYSIQLRACLEKSFHDTYSTAKQVNVRVGLGKSKLMECTTFTKLNVAIDYLREIKEHNVLNYLEDMDGNTYVQVEAFNLLRYQFYNTMNKAGDKHATLRFYDVANGCMLLAYHPSISFAIYVYHTEILGEVDVVARAA